MRLVAPIAALVLLVAAPAPAPAQLLAAADGPIVYGHHPVNAPNVGDHRRFWVDGLGGVPITVGTPAREIVKFANVFVFLTARAPSGGTKGTTVNHVGFETPDLRRTVDRVKAAGFPVVTTAEVPADYTVKDDLAQRPGGNLIAFVMGPDDTKIELIHNPDVAHPIVLHHIHFATPEGPAMQAWYAKTFGGRPGTRIEQPAVDLPGVNLTYGPAPAPTAGTRGRALDHIGFEVRNLEAFCRELEARGVKLDRPYTTVPALGIAIAFLTHPWGTYTELTEGLAGFK